MEYSIPSMAEIAKVKGTNGLTVVSTFSGCGGSCLGLEMAGYDVKYAVEFVEAAREVYRLNHPGVYVDDRDVRNILGSDVLSTLGLGVGELDVLEGSPPCSSFSTSGKRSGGWGEVKKYSDTKQRTDDLFFEFIRLLGDIKPRAFIAENVPGLVRGVAKGYFLDILAQLKGCGYKVEARVLDAQWLGVPQARQRLIFIGVRDDLSCSPVFPKPSKTRHSLADVLLPDAEAIIVGDPKHRQKIGSSWPRGTVIHLDKACPTVQATYKVLGGGGSQVRKKTTGEMRDLTIEELKKICSFPSDFQLTGSCAKQWERLGRSVPPVMMREIGKELAREVFQCVA